MASISGRGLSLNAASTAGICVSPYLVALCAVTRLKRAATEVE